MEISISNQCITFIISIILGGILSLVYDLFRILRYILPENNILIGVEDIIYSLICGIFCMKYILWASSGKLRGYLIFGMVLGWIICHFSLSKIFFELARIIINIISWIYKQTLGRILKLLLKILKNTCKILKKSLKDSRNLLYNLIK